MARRDKFPPGVDERGDRLWHLRQAFGWTQTDVANRSAGRLSREEVSNAERWRNQLGTVEFRRALAEAYGITVEQLMAVVDGQETVEKTKALALPPPAGQAPLPLGVNAVPPSEKAILEAISILAVRGLPADEIRVFARDTRVPPSLKDDGLVAAGAIVQRRAAALGPSVARAGRPRGSQR